MVCFPTPITFWNAGKKGNTDRKNGMASMNVKKTGVTNDVITRDKTEYSSPALAEVVDGINSNE